MGIGVLYGKKKLLEEMQPFLYGGEMIDKVTRFDAIYAEVPHKFEAGTVNAAGAVGLKAAIEYVKKVGFDFIAEREESIVKRIMEGMKEIPYVTVYGNSDYKKHSGIITFNIEGCHPHDVADIMNEEHIDIRAGHHCAQPLMEFLGVSNTARASVYFYNTLEEADRFLAAVAKVRGFMGYKD
jgi:cysteine desulfurase/selenocysteine lyase